MSNPDLQWLPTDAAGERLPRIEVTFTRANGEVTKPYAYAWDGPPLSIGDKVRTPRPMGWSGAHTGIGTVSRLGSGYEGPVLTLTSTVGYR
jgi:hypothetical protein